MFSNQGGEELKFKHTEQKVTQQHFCFVLESCVMFKELGYPLAGLPDIRLFQLLESILPLLLFLEEKKWLLEAILPEQIDIQYDSWRLVFLDFKAIYNAKQKAKKLAELPFRATSPRARLLQVHTVPGYHANKLAGALAMCLLPKGFDIGDRNPDITDIDDARVVCATIQSSWNMCPRFCSHITAMVMDLGAGYDGFGGSEAWQEHEAFDILKEEQYARQPDNPKHKILDDRVSILELEEYHRLNRSQDFQSTGSSPSIAQASQEHPRHHPSTTPPTSASTQGNPATSEQPDNVHTAQDPDLQTTGEKFTQPPQTPRSKWVTLPFPNLAAKMQEVKAHRQAFREQPLPAMKKQKIEADKKTMKRAAELTKAFTTNFDALRRGEHLPGGEPTS